MVIGITKDRIQPPLLSEAGTLLLKQAVEIAKSLEAVTQHLEEIRNNSVTSGQAEAKDRQVAVEKCQSR